MSSGTTRAKTFLTIVGVFSASFSSALGLALASESALLPLPDQLFTPLNGDAAEQDLEQSREERDLQKIEPTLTDAVSLSSENSEINYEHEERRISYTSNGEGKIRLITDTGLDLRASSMQASLNEKDAAIQGPIRVYMAETLTSADSANYNWEEGKLHLGPFKAKVNGFIVRGSSARYEKDEQGRQFIEIEDAYVSTEDAERPHTWVGTGKVRVYLGDYGRVSRLSVAGSNKEMRVPILGWIPFSHSLNPREGYLPNLGTKNIWGAYLLNSYGFLMGNRRVEGGIPVADYIATVHADYRSRRGLAIGLDFEDVEMKKLYPDMKGLSLYSLSDNGAGINPTNTPRQPINKNRYRIAMQTLHKMPHWGQIPGQWELRTNINAVSDAYVLRDFFMEESRVNDKPDNTVSLTHRKDYSESSLLVRFAPNDYYSTDERAEYSYYRVRQPLGESRISYETRNSAGLMRQNLPIQQRIQYQNALAQINSQEVRQYYQRLLNTEQYARVNSTHELSTSFKVKRFLNVTPKVGGAYTGYYGVGQGVGSDNRVMGYVSCDFDIKFSRQFNSVRMPSLGIDGLTHVLHPYATFSHSQLSSSNPLVPQVDAWTSNLGGSTSNPMPLDLLSFTGVDGWASWSVWRMGLQNVLTTRYDGEMRSLLTWNAFFDINVDNPYSDNNFSNLYSVLKMRPTERITFTSEMQFPVIQGGAGYRQYNNLLEFQPRHWLELGIGHRYLNQHPVQNDASQFYFSGNLRLSEKYNFSTRIYWDEEEKRFPIQQYSVFRNLGAWYMGATLYLRDNGGRKETGFGISFTLGETGTALPVNFF